MAFLGQPEELGVLEGLRGLGEHLPVDRRSLTPPYRSSAQEPARDPERDRYAQMVRDTVEPPAVAEAMVTAPQGPRSWTNLGRLENAGVDMGQFLADATPVTARIDADCSSSSTPTRNAVLHAVAPSATRGRGNGVQRRPTRVGSGPPRSCQSAQVAEHHREIGAVGEGLAVADLPVSPRLVESLHLGMVGVDQEHGQSLRPVLQQCRV